MSTKRDDGGPAFPNTDVRYNVGGDGGRSGIDSVAQFGGMTLRDWFAGQALDGLCTDNEYHENATHKQIAEDAYKLADAMIAERNKP